MANRGRNKAFMQDWNIVQSGGNEYQLRQLTQQQQMVLVSLCEYLGWRTRWTNAPSQDDLDAFRARLIYDILTEVECMNCEELTTCLQPLFDAIESVVTSNQDTLNQLFQANEANKIQQPLPVTGTGCDDAEIKGGCYAVLRRLDEEVKAVFARTEAELPDRVDEVISIVGGIVNGLFRKQLEGIPLAEAAALGNWYFENQVEQYNSDYNAVGFLEDASCLLYCAVVANNCTLDTSVLSDWLVSLRTEFPDNDAADIFARFGDAATPTLANQVGTFLNQLRGDSRSITDFYNQLLYAFEIGQTEPNSDWVDCDCSPVWEHTFDLTPGMGAWVFPEVSGFVWGEYEEDVGASATYAIDAAPSVLKQFIMRLVIPANTGSVLTSFKFNYSLSKATIEASTSGRDSLSLNSTPIWQIHPASLNNAAETDYSITGLSAALNEGDTLDFRLICQRVYTTVTDAGFAKAHSITLYGTGDNPFS